MELGEAILTVGAGDRAASFELFSETLDAEWIAQALQATGTATIRRRKLPAEYVVWLVIGMGLLRDRSIREVVRHLDLVLPTRGGRSMVSGAAIVQARDRLGPEPLAALFAQTAAVWGPAAADEARWRGLAVYGVDGTTLRVPDTEENEAGFGRVATRWESTGGYPQLRLVALMVLGQHLLTGLAVGAFQDSELALATTLWPQLPDASVVIVDREFAVYALFHQLGDPARQRHWLTRAKTGATALRRRVVERLGPGDHLVDLCPSHQTRFVHRDLPPTLRVRAIRYQRRGFRAQTLLTSLLDPVAYPAAELIALYHERWELELGFDEVKTHTLEREEALRSKTPARVTPGSLRARHRLQPRAPRHGPRRRARPRAACADQLPPCAPIHPPLLAHRVDCQPGRAAAAARGAARRTRAAHPAGTPPGASLPARRQDQDEQLSA